MNITQIYTHPSRYKPRGTQPPVAIILHEVNEPLGALGARIGTNLINALKPTAHQSYHYALDGAAVHAFVDPAQAARALDDTEVLTGWTPQAGFPGLDPDLYTLNIAVIVGSAPIGDNLCIPCCGREYSQVMMWNLRRLLHQLATEYEIDVSGDLLWLHGDELCDICLDDLRIPPEVVTPGEEDWLCDRLAEMPVGDADAPMLVGNDCHVYPYPQSLCDALSDLPLVINPDPVLVGTDCKAHPAYTVVKAGLCLALADLVNPGNDPMPELIGNDCNVYTPDQLYCQAVNAVNSRQPIKPEMCAEYVLTPDCKKIPLDDGDWEIYRDPVTGECKTGRQTPFGNVASGDHAIAEGFGVTASGLDSHAEGQSTQATATAAHAEGYETIASGGPSHAEGRGSHATAGSAHAEGRDTIASGSAAHAEGTGTQATAPHSHAEGAGSVASDTFSHAEGHDTVASGSAAHAEGENTVAAGLDSHAQNRETDALGPYTDASGYQSRALVRGEAAQANGMFEFRGDAQKRTIHWMLDSISQDANSYVPLIITGEPTDMIIDANTVQNWHIQIVGSVAGASQTWMFNIDAGVRNSVAAEVLAQSVTTVYASDANYSVELFADVLDNTVKIRIHKGASADNYHVRWYAFAHIAQIIY